MATSLLNAQERIQFLVIDSVLKSHYKAGKINVIGNFLALNDLRETTEIDCRLPDPDLIISGNQLNILLNGTGRIYRLDSIGNPIREDLTCYGGSSFGSINLNYRDTIYSIGGYGFWQFNSAIRFYKETLKEWDIIPANRQPDLSAGLNAIPHYGYDGDKVYLIYKSVKPEYLNIQPANDTVFVQCLDLKSKRWWDSPKVISNEIAIKIEEISAIHETGLGLLIHSRRMPYALVLDFEKNLAYKVDPSLSSDFIQNLKKINQGITFYDKQAIFLYDAERKSLKKYLFSIDKSASNSIKLYQQRSVFTTSISKENIYLLTIGFLLFAIIFLLIKKRTGTALEKTQGEIRESATLINNTSVIFINSLTEVERELLKVIIKNQNDGKNTSVSEVNVVLGLDKKPFKIQNNARASAISELNKRFSVFATNGDKLVIRERSSFDQRYFEYKIERKYLKLFNDI